MDRRRRLDFSRGGLGRYAMHCVYPRSTLSTLIPAGSRICWNTIAEHLPGRNNKSCRKRWIHSLDPSLRKGSCRLTFPIIVLTPVQAGGQHLKTRFLSQLCEGTVVTGTKLQNYFRVEPMTSVPKDGGRNLIPQSVSYLRRDFLSKLN